MASKPTKENIQNMLNISKQLNLTFNADQIEALISVFEAGADPDCVMRWLSENASSNLSQTQSPSIAATSSAASTSSVYNTPNRYYPFKDPKNFPDQKDIEKFGPN